MPPGRLRRNLVSCFCYSATTAAPVCIDKRRKGAGPCCFDNTGSAGPATEPGPMLRSPNEVPENIEFAVQELIEVWLISGLPCSEQEPGRLVDLHLVGAIERALAHAQTRLEQHRHDVKLRKLISALTRREKQVFN